MENRLLLLVVAALLGIRCHGYRFFQDRIPNGANVPHPCRTGDIWIGVGHLNEGGGGERNPFGLDFHKNGKKWDRTLCLMDSDGDGLLNGEELGDPDCVWEPGKAPTRTDELSHPGVCDPWNSPECKAKTTFVKCDGNKLKCPPIEEPGVTNFTVRLPDKTPVPAQETTYKCMVFEFPQDADYHMIANEPIIDNIDVMHHILIVGCDHDGTKYPPNQPYDCEMEVDAACPNIIGVWSFGMVGQCEHEDMGFRIGTKGFKRGVLQYHWNNPQERGDFVDSSGVILHLTTNLRPHDAGILTVGQDYLVIPPQEEHMSVTGVCSAECTQNLIKKDIKVPVAFNHMHGLGKSQRVEQYRDGIKIRDITYDPKYDYNTPELHIYDTPITLRPGDEIRTECVFTSMSRQKTTFFGDGTHDEMCYSFITFYPIENIPDKAMCAAWQDVTLCSFNISDVIEGCRFKELHDVSIPSMKATYDRVMEHCSPYIGCRKECLSVVRDLKQTACYRPGTVNDWARQKIEQEATEPVKMMKFYAALDSCDIELTKEEALAQCPVVPEAENGGVNKAPILLVSKLMAFVVGFFVLAL